VLRGELTNLRAVERSDDAFLHHWFNDPSVMRGWGLPAAVVSTADVQRRIEGWLDEEARRGWPAALVIETLEGEAVGLVVLTGDQSSPRVLEVSLLIGDPEQWGKGLGGDALAVVAECCFEQWNVHRLQLRSEAGNERAHRLYRRLGFRHEGTLREATWMDGRFEDVLVFARLVTDPEPGAG
jgi:RimJ/RimL family protein N-acetyltransferase